MAKGKTAPKGKFVKQNNAVKKSEENISAKDDLLKRIGARLDTTKMQSDVILNVVLSSIEETTVAKGALNLTGFAKLEVVDKPASEGTIQFGERKGEKWTKPAHKAVKISNISAFWNEIANDEQELVAIDSLENVWAEANEEVEDADDIEDTEEEAEEEEEEAPAPKKAPAKKTPAKKAPAKK